MAWILATILKFVPLSHFEWGQILEITLQFGVRINIVLAVFNLIPIPPLDGSKILFTLLPHEYSHVRDNLERYGFFILIFILFLPPTRDLLFFIINAVYRFFVMSYF